MGATIEAIEDPKSRVGELGGLHQPPEIRAGVRRETEPQERAHGERGVAHPREAIVPVALSADVLGERSRRGCGDGPRRSVYEQLERQGAPDDRVVPGT